MRRLALIPLLVLLAPPTARGQNLAGRYVYETAQGPVTLELQHQGTQVSGVMTGVDGSRNRLEGVFDGQKATGTFTTTNGSGWFAVGVLEGTLTLLVAELDPATGEPDLDNGWRLDFMRTGDAAAQPATAGPAEASGASKGATGTPLVREWTAHLAGKKITYIDSYSSSDAGGYGGYSDRWEAYLCRDGTFQFRSRSSVNADVGGVFGGSSGSDSFTGQWRIVEHNGQAILQYQRSELVGTDEGQWVALAHRDGETYFDGSRVYVTADNDLCR
jgi:hypothetical protein